MRPATSVEQAVKHIIALRSVGEEIADPRARQRLKRIERELRRDLGVGIPKTRAAAVLGVSVTALDKWIARGKLPVVRRPGSSRQEIDADALLDIAAEVTRLREDGQSRGLLAAAFERLAAEGKPRPRPRPNQSARELRQRYLETTRGERLRETAELSRVLTELAGRGAAAARRRGSRG